MKVSERQNKIVDLLVQGKTQKEISITFNCSVKTIENDIFWLKEYYGSKTLIQAIYKHYENTTTTLRTD